MLPENVTATALVSLDKDVIATASKISEGDIIEELRDRQGQGEEERSTYCLKKTQKKLLTIYFK